MTPERYQRVKELYLAAAELPADDQAAHLAKACGDDGELRREVEKLLAARSEQPTGFLERPAMAQAARLLAETPSDATVSEPSLLLELGAGDAGALPDRRLRDLDPDLPLPEGASGHDRYRLLGKLGEGGMGDVYLAYDHDLKRRIALKLVKTERPELARLFVEEAQLMAQLDHPNIVPLHDVGLTGGRPYYTMRLMLGDSLRDVLKRLRDGDAATRAVYSLAKRMQALVDVCQAVSFAHRKGVAHLDLKPANVMLGEDGEVQVMDWGLSRILQDAGDGSEQGGAIARAVAGTPHYMAPEQASGQAVDERADVYALGVILYELLTLERPFEGDTYQVIAAKLEQRPEPPRQRCPEAAIPLELNRLCLAALETDRGARLESAAALEAGVATWLEAQADKERRHQLAEAKAAEGKARLDEYFRLKEEVKRLDAEAEAVAQRHELWQPLEEKAELFAARAAVEETRGALTDTAASVVETLERALEYEEEHVTARRALAAYYWDRFQEAERRQARDDQNFFHKRIARYDEGTYAHVLAGDGSLTLTSEPPGAEVWLSEYLEEGPLLVARRERKLGVTPIAGMTLPMGSYLVVLKHAGYRDVRYPVHITRNRAWTGTVKLRTDQEIGAGFCYVPGGPFLVAGLIDTFSSLLLTRIRPPVRNISPREQSVGDFAIAEHPVTVAEYVTFLNELASSEGLEAARACSPRALHSDPQSSYLLEDGAGRLLPRGKDEFPNPREPVYGLSAHDAEAYCAWRSEREGRELRLPTSREWEKAGRGVDGRWFPWGNGFDDGLCNALRSLRDRPDVVPIDAFPTDVSVYGVRGLAGNVRDWTSTSWNLGTGPDHRVVRAYRGGSWNDDSTLLMKLSTVEPTAVYPYIGFRLARSLP